MSTDSTNIPQEPRNRLSTSVGFLLSPFLWVAVAGLIFIGYNLWPENGDVSTPSQAVEIITSGPWGELWDQIAGSPFMAMMTIALVGIMISGLYGYWTEKPKYTMVAVTIIGALGFLFIIGGGLIKFLTEAIWQHEAYAVREAFRLKMATTLDPRHWVGGGPWNWLLIGGVILGVLLLISIFSKGKGGKKPVDLKINWGGLLTVIVVGLLLWLIIFEMPIRRPVLITPVKPVVVAPVVQPALYNNNVLGELPDLLAGKKVRQAILLGYDEKGDGLCISAIGGLQKFAPSKAGPWTFQFKKDSLYIGFVSATVHEEQIQHIKRLPNALCLIPK